ncbi:MAG TPA: hypothetical protein VH722_03160 [Alphaproteobacteria bacterium]|jgi:hypothetical protein|nr:hypothetical protein [Alphaproteobacteria bacterium]
MLLSRLIGLAAILAACAGSAWAADQKLPWGESSDMAAWRTLSMAVAPSGNPADHKVELETWATDQDIYTATPHWPAAAAPKQLRANRVAPDQSMSNLHALVVTPNQCFQPLDAQAGNFPPTGCIGEEIRRNYATYQYIVSNGLYSTEGLQRAWKAHLKVDLPADATQFKGDWIRVPDLIAWLRRVYGMTVTREFVRNNYYTNTATAGRVTDEFALVGFHFMSKQIKARLWIDFEHRLNPGRCDTIGCHDDFGALQPEVTPRATANQNYGPCEKTPALKAMMAAAGLSPVWENYCLKGTEIGFVDPDGKPKLLGNSVIERINSKDPIARSSCTTCHAYAAFNREGKPGLLDFTNKVLPTGEPNQDRLKGYVHNDSIWGIANLATR